VSPRTASRVVWLGVVLAASSGVAAERPPRPRVGLALAGGAAKAIAHVGVLRWLEEHRVPVDYVAGTSMGALIAAGYATGMRPEEVRELLAALDWRGLFTGDVPYPLKSFRRKQDRRRYPARPELGLRGGFKLASGLDAGHQAGLTFSRLALPYSTLDSFDDLPIPFRCVATDIENAQIVVLSDGSLAQALRATMAIPAIFTPVQRDGRLLVDGGVLNNLPVDVALEMGADRVIAVHLPVQRSLDSRSLLGLASRALDVMVAETGRRNLALADVVVAPDIEGYDSMDWDRIDELVDVGYRAAEARARELQALSLDEESWREHLEARRQRRRQPLASVRDLSVTGVPPRDAGELAETLWARLDGQPFSPVRLEEELTLLVGAGRYESALYEARPEGEDAGLLVRLQEKRHAPPFVNFAADVRTQADELVFNFGARMTALDTLGLGSELRFDVAAGSRVGLGLELYRPLGRSRLFVAPRLLAQRTSDNIFEDDALVANLRQERVGVGFDLGFAGGRLGELRVGYEASHLDARARVGDPERRLPSGPEQRFELRGALDTLDRGSIPTRGVRIVATGRYYTEVPGAETGSDDRFPLAAMGLIAGLPLHRRGHLLLDVQGGTTFDAEPPSLYRFSLGGPFRLGGFEEDEFRGRHYAYASASYWNEVGRLTDLVGGGIYLVAGLDVGAAFDTWEDVPIRGDLSLGAVVDTALGPLYAGAALGSRGHLEFHVSFGVPFPFRSADAFGTILP